MEKPFDKWSQPGWRIEQKYGNKVLIGNWVEQKLQVGILSRYFLLSQKRTTKPLLDDSVFKTTMLCNFY